MSLMAMKWAMDDAPVTTSSDFATLIVFANYANEHGRAYPSTETVATKSRQNAKTVRAAIDRLEDAGLLTDTGARVGRTGNVKVYALAMEGIPEVGSLKGERASEALTASSEAAEGQSAETPPNPAGLRSGRKAPVSGSKGTQIRVAEPVLEPDTPEDASASSAPKGRRSRSLPMASDWQPAEIEDLPEPARSIARQWPAGAYASSASGHRAHMIGSGKRAADHNALWAARVVQLGAGPIRDGKAGLQYATPAAAGAKVDRGSLERSIALYERMNRPDEAAAMRRMLAGG